MQNPITNVIDCVLLTISEGKLCVALFKRTKDGEPHKGEHALPGGFVRTNEDTCLEDTLARVLKEKAGVSNFFAEQLKTFGGPHRDPARGWSICTAYYSLVPRVKLQIPDGIDYVLRPVDEIGKLPFDHAEIIQEAVSRVKSKSAFSSLPMHLCGEEFTITRLRHMYELLLGTTIDQQNFRRKMAVLDAIEPIPGKKIQEGEVSRPAQLYRLKSKDLFLTGISIKNSFS